MGYLSELNTLTQRIKKHEETRLEESFSLVVNCGLNHSQKPFIGHPFQARKSLEKCVNVLEFAHYYWRKKPSDFFLLLGRP